MWLLLWCACLWHVVHPAGYQGISDLSSLGEFVGASPKCSCQPSPNASDGELIHLQQWNCKRITQAGIDYAQLAANYGQKVDQDWKERLQTASAMCEEAQNSSDLNLKACKAVCAWGDVLMQGRECCNVPGPPYCTNPGMSKLGHGSVLALALLVALLAAFLPKCSSSFFAPSLMLISPAEDPRADDGGQEIYRQIPSPQISAFSKELQAIWNHRSLRSLPEAEKHKEDSANCFAQMQVAFDFQQDSVKNQYEHFISLWRSHVAVLCDRKMKKPEDSTVLTEALKELHGDLLASFLLWRQEFCAGNNERVTNAVYKWDDDQKMHRATLEMDQVHLHEVALFLLVWGEAANLRFMPEMLYFITHVMLEAGPSCYFEESSESVRNHAKAIRCSGDGYGRSSAFLVDIVRPIYKVIFEEHYESVTVRGGKDIKKLKPSFDRYLPADAANHDDWNELFQDLLFLQVSQAQQALGTNEIIWWWYPCCFDATKP